MTFLCEVMEAHLLRLLDAVLAAAGNFHVAAGSLGLFQEAASSDVLDVFHVTQFWNMYHEYVPFCSSTFFSAFSL
jgi:hypothetical protein